MKIEKNEDSKWFVDESVTNLLDEDDTTYPQYCSGKYFQLHPHGKGFVCFQAGCMSPTQKLLKGDT